MGGVIAFCLIIAIVMAIIIGIGYLGYYLVLYINFEYIINWVSNQNSFLDGLCVLGAILVITFFIGWGIKIFISWIIDNWKQAILIVNEKERRKK